jgi:hypothetical protein
VRAEAGGFTDLLALEAEDTTEQRCQAEAQDDIEELAQCREVEKSVVERVDHASVRDHAAKDAF